jgi:hypothetical protein
MRPKSSANMPVLTSPRQATQASLISPTYSYVFRGSAKTTVSEMPLTKRKLRRPMRVSYVIIHDPADHSAHRQS